MRSDMHKVIVERPRVGGDDYYKPGRDAQREKLDPEFAPTKESMRGRRATKSLNEHLAPLRRFLLKNVGRPWNKVHSEISKHLRMTSAVQAHVLQHVDDYVEEHPIMVDGVPHRTGVAGLTPVAGGRLSLYVCPRSGLLKIAKPPKKKKPKHPPPEAHRIGPIACAVKLRGCWHEATMHQAPYVMAHVSGNVPIYDAVLGAVYSRETLAGFYPPWKGQVQYATKIRPMTRDEIRKLPF